jgi:predicted enzyme related to lactoylglutathione lyase
VFRPGAVSYLRIPASNAEQASSFYTAVFGWHARAGSSSFEDASGHVIGHFMEDMAVAGEAGVRPYIYVESVEQTLRKLHELGGELVTAPYPEGELTVATFRDPSGNVIGVWQRAGRPA